MMWPGRLSVCGVLRSLRRFPRIKAYTNYDNYVGVGTWTKVAINNTDYNDQGAFDAGNNRFVAPADGTYLFGATLLYKVNASTSARMSGRMVMNGATEIRGSRGETSGAHVSEATALWLQTMVALFVVGPDPGVEIDLQFVDLAVDLFPYYPREKAARL
ncbi:hypothetical protein [Pikeienuella piscinae]|uniref:hypothetical protein n=1 Tax=Pikeienuella piscinae TaxID=2748098 RepID=UPI001FE7502A|nr:hypothetical protein [Pikeienuella piscinae]